MDKINIMLVDDHVLVREGTREMLDRQQDLLVVAEAGDGEEAIQLAGWYCPDVIIMDIEMPKINGIEATKRIKETNPAISILVLTAYDNDQYVFALLGAGAAGYLLKDVSTNELIQAVRAVSVGESVLHPIVARKVIDYFTQHPGQAPARESVLLDPLTKREMEVLQLASKGIPNRKIAKELTLSVRTVEVHLRNIFSKLDVGSRTEAVLYALRRGWLLLEDTL
ncbi:response regulator [Planctomycetota bacterium]